MHALLPDHKIRHVPHPLELQHVPIRPALVHLRVQLLQAQNLSSLYLQSLTTITTDKHPTNTHQYADTDTDTDTTIYTLRDET